MFTPFTVARHIQQISRFDERVNHQLKSTPPRR